MTSYPTAPLLAAPSFAATNVAKASDGVVYLSEAKGNRIQKLAVEEVVGLYGPRRD